MLPFLNQYALFFSDYAVIFALSALTYYLGFARKLPLLKNVMVYVCMLVGVFPLVVLATFGLPIIPALVLAIVVLLLARLRRKNEKPLREATSDTRGVQS